MQLDLKRRGDEIEKKTKEVDLLNRKYEKLQSRQQGGPEAGMLSFVIVFSSFFSSTTSSNKFYFLGKARKDCFCSHVALTISLSCLVALGLCCQAEHYCGHG